MILLYKNEAKIIFQYLKTRAVPTIFRFSKILLQQKVLEKNYLIGNLKQVCCVCFLNNWF